MGGLDLQHEPSSVRAAEKRKGPLLIRFRNKLYDVTNFKHPGGAVIRTHLWSPEEQVDSTSTIMAFHQRAMGDVALLLKELPVVEPPVPLAPRDPVEVDFGRLRAELLAKGFFDASIPHVIYRILSNAAMWAVGLWCIAQPSVLLTALGIFICASAYMMCGWIQHEAGHNSFTGYSRLDRLIQSFYFNIVLVGNFRKWNHQHFSHHACTQHTRHDVDLKTMPLVAFNAETWQSKGARPGFFVRYQHVLYWLVINPIVWFVWGFLTYPIFAYKKGHLLEFGLTRVAAYAFHWTILRAWGHSAAWTIFFMHAYSLVGLSLLLSMFTVSHTTTEARDEDIGWVRPASSHTINQTDHPVTNWWMGYLNFQIEHHLFPTMPQYRHPEVSRKYIKPFFAKHGIPYQENGFFASHYEVFKNLRKVARMAAEPQGPPQQPKPITESK